jgi:hypothetical protein
VDERATLSGLESEDDVEPSHRFLAVLSSLWAEAILPTDLEYGSPRTKAYDDRSNQTSRQDARGRHKLTPPWEGPFIIAKILKPGTYKLANDQGEVYNNTWNIQQLRRFYP